MKQIYVYLFDGFSDWEIAYVTPEIKKSEEFELNYFSKDGKMISSMGGMRVQPHSSLKDIESGNIEVLILPGGTAWETSEKNEIEVIAKEVHNSGKTIAAICAATTYLGQLGLLNDIQHTSNDLDYLKTIAPDYSGEKNYQNSLAVTDQNVITANGIAPIEFARELFKKIGLYDNESIEKWYQLFKNGVWEG